MCHELGQLHVENYDQSIIETYPLRVRLVMVKFCYPDNEILEGLYQAYLSGHVDKRRDERYAERTYLYIVEERLYEDK